MEQTGSIVKFTPMDNIIEDLPLNEQVRILTKSIEELKGDLTFMLQYIENFGKLNSFTSGSNNTGTWIKFSDGQMIVYGEYTQQVTSVTALGGVYYMNFTTQNFPATFISSPVRCFFSGRSSEIVGLTTRAASATTFQARGYFAENLQNRQMLYSMFTIGRWK